MPSPVVNIDPDGEVFIVIPKPAVSCQSDLANEDDSEKATSTIGTEDDVMTEDGNSLAAYLLPGGPFNEADEENKKKSVLRLRVSKKHLIMTSARAKAMYQMDCKESQPDPNGFFHWEFGPNFNQIAFQIVMNIIHGQTNEIPHTVTLDMLAEVAAVTDDLRCHNAVSFMTDAWLERLQRPHPTDICPDLYKWILIALVFGQPECFRSTTRVAIMQCTGPMFSGGTPVNPAILESIESSRRDLLGELIAEAEQVIQRLRQGNSPCTFECRSMLLGALMQEMHRAGLYPPPSGLLPNISLSTALHRMRDFQSPPVYTSRSDVDDVQDGYESHEPNVLWRPGRDHVEGEYPYSHPKKAKKHRRVVSVSRTWAQEEVYDGSKTLFMHQCSLRRLLEPVIHAMEGKIIGLDLNDFSRGCQTSKAV